MGVYDLEEEFSPTDTSEDSIDIRVKSIRTCPAGNRKNKRKSNEPRRFNLESSEFKRRRLNSTGSEERSPQNLSQSRTPSPSPNFKPPVSQDIKPRESISPQHLAPKKRFKLDALREIERLEEKSESNDKDTQGSPNPFRPWSETKESSPPTHVLIPEVPCIPFFLQGFHTDIPLALLPGLAASSLLLPLQQPVQEEPLSLVKEKKPEPDSDSDNNNKPFHVEKLLESPRELKVSTYDSVTIKTEPESELSSPDDKSKQRNYKNLTRERRVEANARERQRVHTITAAFDTLQEAIPTHEENIKLSKLSVIKIATAYIMALSRMAGHDYTEDRSAPSVESVLNLCRETIQTETKIKNRKN